MSNTPSIKPVSPTLWLVPTPLDFGTSDAVPLESIIPAEVIKQAVQIPCWIVENAKTARAVLKRFSELCPLTQSLQEMEIIELPREVHKKGDKGYDARPLLKQALQNHQQIGLMSEAGLPTIADPGSSVVMAAHQLKVQVCPMVGPSSLLLSLMGSGLNGQNFAFVGYLPKSGAELTQRIKELELLATGQIKGRGKVEAQTQLFIETPYRNKAMLQSLLQTLAPESWLSIGFGVTLPQGEQITLRVSDWKNKRLSDDLLKLPAVYLLGQ